MTVLQLLNLLERVPAEQRHYEVESVDDGPFDDIEIDTEAQVILLVP